MNYTTIEFRPSKRDRAIKPVLGALAALATVATLGLLVAGPVALSPAGDATDPNAHVGRRPDGCAGGGRIL